MKKIIVTGGLGFIGSNLIETLLKKNYYVLNLDKVTYSSNFYNTREFARSKRYKFGYLSLIGYNNSLDILSELIFLFQ